MAWLIGKVDRKERRELERRGWLLEKPATYFGGAGSFDRDDVAVYVDTDLFDIMSGARLAGINHGLVLTATLVFGNVGAVNLSHKRTSEKGAASS